MCSTEDDTRLLAARLANELPKGVLIALEGPPGSGKTVFAQGFAAALGVQDEVTSPSYPIVNDYLPHLYHFDLYRIETETELDELGFTDYLEQGVTCLVEWMSRFPAYARPDVRVEFALAEPAGRLVTVHRELP